MDLKSIQRIVVCNYNNKDEYIKWWNLKKKNKKSSNILSIFKNDNKIEDKGQKIKRMMPLYIRTFKLWSKSYKGNS